MLCSDVVTVHITNPSSPRGWLNSSANEALMVINSIALSTTCLQEVGGGCGCPWVVLEVVVGGVLLVVGCLFVNCGGCG